MRHKDKHILENLINKYGLNFILNETSNISNIYKDLIPEDCGLNDNPAVYETNGKYLRYEYFGNCVNTVPTVWDASQMANWLKTCDILIDNDLTNKLMSGDNKLPIRLLKLLDKYSITDFEHFVCGIDDYQKIMFIYSVDTDIHYFFDCIKR